MDDRTRSRGGWEHFPHGADVGVRGIGASKDDAFEQAALALTAVITDPTTVTAVDCIELCCAAPDDELLLVNWLNALIYEMATRKMLFGHFQVRIDKGALRAKAWGEPMDAARHELAIEVKGATCTELAVKQDAIGSWIAQCVVDV
ncbi:MAG TPA: archease [Candidatus Binatia bacterium]|jgi:tRNA nucleotidyltransferase (CCA-adding enzyme)